MIPAAFVLSAEQFSILYHSADVARIERHTGRAPLIGSGQWTQHREVLRSVEVLFSGWGAPRMNDEFLAAVPRLKVVFYAAGTIRYFVTEAFWRRGIRITAAPDLNAIPVSEYTSSVILLGLKRFWHFARTTREQKSFSNHGPTVGAYHATVGLISYGRIARLVRSRLLSSQVKVLVYDPFLTEREARSEHVHLASLDQVFATSDAVSLHTPLLKETVGLITGRHFAQMKPGAIFINTARGEVVNEPQMLSCLRERPDLQAIIDVTHPQPPAADSLLFSLPNVVLTPHIAGSLGNECRRLGHAMVDEFERFVQGRPLQWELTPETAAVMA